MGSTSRHLNEPLACTLGITGQNTRARVLGAMSSHQAAGSLQGEMKLNGDFVRLGTNVPGAHQFFWGPPRQMWLGKVKHIVHVECPAGGEEEVLDVEWHKTADAPLGPYDAQLMAPIVYKEVHKDVRFICCSTVLPIKVDAVKEHPFRRHLLLMLRRSWLPLSVLGLPVPWPRLKHELSLGSCPWRSLAEL